MAGNKVYKERTNFFSAFIAVLFVVIGIALLSVAAKWEWLADHPGTQIVVRQVGGLLIASVGVGFVWALVGRRAFLDEVLAKVQLSEEVRSAGLRSINMNYEREIDWGKLFKNVKRLDIFIAYGRTWRRNHITELRNLAARGDCRVRLVLPDPTDAGLMSELARRFQTTDGDVISRIKEAEKEFVQVFGYAANIDFTLWFLPASPVFSYYRFDDMAVLTLYNHRRKYVPVPAFVMEQEGSLFKYLYEDFREIVEGTPPLARKVFPLPAPESTSSRN